MKTISMVAKILVIVGGINWGLVGIGMLAGSNLNVVNLIFGSWPTLETIIYILVGISAVLTIFGKGCSCGVTSSSNNQSAV